MTYAWHDVIGNIGVVLILVIYLLLQMEKLVVSNPMFSSLNGLGALMILVSLTQNFNLSAFVIEFVWLVVSVYGFIRYRNARARAVRENR